MWKTNTNENQKKTNMKKTKKEKKALAGYFSFELLSYAPVKDSSKKQKRKSTTCSIWSCESGCAVSCKYI